ncbi:zinc-binding dehydrogenase [Streptomyces sp. NPDC048629]|uniref:zinc-binding dehydrogenase n=1 Tax=Streptomyces sp. NPDC048629 TaxID=3154824 RepID=UPI00343B9842
METGLRVLVNGAGGGAGGFVTQLAKYAGAEVIATAGPWSTAAVLRQEADHVIDYTARPVTAALDGRQVDILFNLVPLSPQDAAALVPLVRRGGRIVSIADVHRLGQAGRIRGKVLIRPPHAVQFPNPSAGLGYASGGGAGAGGVAEGAAVDVDEGAGG